MSLTDWLIVDRDLEARESDRLAIKTGTCKGEILRAPVDPVILRDYPWHSSYYASCSGCGRTPWRCACTADDNPQEQPPARWW
jgi:hypothetical protein